MDARTVVMGSLKRKNSGGNFDVIITVGLTQNKVNQLSRLKHLTS